jgi:hypothetical protein
MPVLVPQGFALWYVVLSRLTDGARNPRPVGAAIAGGAALVIPRAICHLSSKRLSENSRLPNRRPYELLIRIAEGLFLQSCPTKTYASEANERLFVMRLARTWEFFI